MATFCIAFYESYLSMDERNRPERLDRLESGTIEKALVCSSTTLCFQLLILILNLKGV
jgi:hypothetical protein